jgi:hypothetical protein
MTDSFQSFLVTKRLERDAEVASLRTSTANQKPDRVEFMSHLARTLGRPRGCGTVIAGKRICELEEFTPNPEVICRRKTKMDTLLENPEFCEKLKSGSKEEVEESTAIVRMAAIADFADMLNMIKHCSDRR